MKQSFQKWTLVTVTAGALGLPLSGAWAEDALQARTQPLLVAAGEAMDEAGDTVSDTWITSKVKASFLADDSLSGMDIKVETNQGVVSLSGVVGSEAEKDLAVQKAMTIKGVKDVSADGLTVAD